MKHIVHFTHRTHHGEGNWAETTRWIQENKTGNWGWMPGNPGYFSFDKEEDKVRFILRWV